MSIKLMSLVWESEVGPATKRLVLLALADSANDEGVCWPSVATIARKAGASRRRTEEVLAELEGDGVVVKRQRWNESNVYTLHLDRIPRPVETPREIRGGRKSRGAREEPHEPPAKSAGPPREDVGPNRKRTQREPSGGTRARTHARDGDAQTQEPPSPRCPQHINHDGDPGPCRACGTARRAAEEWQQQQALRATEDEIAERRQRAANKAAARANCGMCDADGYVGLRPCDHDPGQAERNRQGAARARAALATRRGTAGSGPPASPQEPEQDERAVP